MNRARSNLARAKLWEAGVYLEDLMLRRPIGCRESDQGAPAVVWHTSSVHPRSGGPAHIGWGVWNRCTAGSLRRRDSHPVFGGWSVSGTHEAGHGRGPPGGRRTGWPRGAMGRRSPLIPHDYSWLDAVGYPLGRQTSAW